MESDRSYYRRRASEENLAAALAGGPEARRAHLELAARFSALANTFEASGLAAEGSETPHKPGITLSLEHT